jgi:hypothetical protein
MRYLVITGLLFLHYHSAIADTMVGNTATNQLIESYRSLGSDPANAQRGQQLWTTKFPGGGQFSERSCTTCHSDRLSKMGRHIRTGKPIQPLAPSTNANSLTDRKKIEKWLLRNCKWTLGRECTVQEKSDLLAYMSQQ